MTSHVRALAILQIVYASIGLLLGVLAFLVFGGIAAIVGLNAPIDESAIAVPVLTLIGSLAASLLILLSLPRLIAGVGLLQLRPWARILTIIVSVLGILEFPVGTAIGVYGLWVLTHKEGAVLFDRNAPRPA